MARKSRNYPNFLGQPSPSLAKLQKMNPAQLAEHVERLGTERQRLADKISRLQATRSPDPQRLSTLNSQLSRLQALERVAKQRMTERSAPRPHGGSYGRRAGLR